MSRGRVKVRARKGKTGIPDGARESSLPKRERERSKGRENLGSARNRRQKGVTGMLEEWTIGRGQQIITFRWPWREEEVPHGGGRKMARSQKKGKTRRVELGEKGKGRWTLKLPGSFLEKFITSTPLLNLRKERKKREKIVL